MKSKVLAVQAAAVAVAVLLAACTASDADKSGGPREPIQLVVANNDGNLEGVPALRHFLERATALSEGRLSFRVVSFWQGGNDETHVIKDVASGKADLGWAGTRAFDLVGVDAFRAFHAPLLISSYAAEAAVVRDMAAGLLPSLHSIGLTGLALVADELRHPAGVLNPLLSPKDFHGLTFGTVASGAQSDGIRALGATPSVKPIWQAAASGQLGGFETMWWTYTANGFPSVAPFIAANINLWPRSWVLFANPSTLSGLSDQARGWLTRAGNETSQWSTGHAADAEAVEIARACRQGARIAMATQGQLAELRSAFEPVYAALRSDPVQGKTLEQIEGLVAQASPDRPVDIPDGCAAVSEAEPSTPPSVRVLSGPGRPGRLPEGVYRYRISADELRAKGLSEADVRLNAGVFTWTLRGGSWSLKQEPVFASATGTSCGGFYDVSGGSASFTTTTVLEVGSCSPPTWTAQWKVEDGELTWSEVSEADLVPVFAPRPWKRIA
ncbi:MAG TPA: hypothetical protein VLC50_07080 [Actinomycetes bacterium]|nr:hypothetical protein [Actinomycetes bacterium]